MKRAFDILFGCLATLIMFVPMLLVAIAVRLTSKGHAMYRSGRVGRNNVIFRMPKFHSMKEGPPAVGTDLLANARSHLTLISSFLLGKNLEELPQFWSILAVDMRFVGPRPAGAVRKDDVSADG